jgi:phosphoglycolate phosphatase
MSHVIDALALDLDGTLIDTAQDIGAALNIALSSEGLKSAELEQVRAWIGDGPDVLIARALVAQARGDASPDLRAKLRQRFDKATLEAPMANGLVYPGIKAALAQLQRVMPLVVITNKPTQLARAVIEAAGLMPIISRVWGADTPGERKPLPTLLLRAAAFLGVPPTRLMMLGDGPADLLSAYAAGCPSALATWGYGAHKIPHELKTLRVETPQALQAHLMTAHTTH